MNIVNIQIKEELKQIAKDIRLQKRLLKSKQREITATYSDHLDLDSLKCDFRYKHVARSLLRGTPYECIEPKVRTGNEIDMDLVESYKQEYIARFEEVSHE